MSKSGLQMFTELKMEGLEPTASMFVSRGVMSTTTLTVSIGERVVQLSEQGARMLNALLEDPEKMVPMHELADALGLNLSDKTWKAQVVHAALDLRHSLAGASMLAYVITHRDDDGAFPVIKGYSLLP